MFQLKDFRSILASMVNLVRGVSTELTDFNPGSVVRTLLESSAIEIEELYLQFYYGVTEAIPVAIYDAFDFGQRPAVAAYGYATFSRATPATAAIDIVAGTTVQTEAGLSFAVAEAVVLNIGETSVDALVVCSIPGITGNIAAGTLNVITSAVTGIEAVTNGVAFTTGTEAETEVERKNRFRDYIATLARGTRSALIYAAKKATVSIADVVVERVTQARVIEYDDAPSTVPIGTARVIIHNGANGASSDLVAAAQRIVSGYLGDDGVWVPGYKAAGVVAPVDAALVMSVDVVETLTIATGFDPAVVAAQVEEYQATYIAGSAIGGAVLRSELIAAAMAVDGVYNVSMSTPTADVTISIDQVAAPGAFTITTA